MVLAEPCIFYACKNDQCTNFVQLTTFFTVSPDKVMSYKIFANSSPQVELMAVLMGYTPPPLVSVPLGRRLTAYSVYGYGINYFTLFLFHCTPL